MRVIQSQECCSYYNPQDCQPYSKLHLGQLPAVTTTLWFQFFSFHRRAPTWDLEKGKWLFLQPHRYTIKSWGETSFSMGFKILLLFPFETPSSSWPETLALTQSSLFPMTQFSLSPSQFLLLKATQFLAILTPLWYCVTLPVGAFASSFVSWLLTEQLSL